MRFEAGSRFSEPQRSVARFEKGPEGDKEKDPSRGIELAPVSPHILAIYTAPYAGEPMFSRQLPVYAVAGSGLIGDRYEKKQGHFSGKRVSDELRQVTFISQDAIAEANSALRERDIEPFTPQETRRNVLLEIPTADLNGLVGRRFRIGEAEFEGVELCAPCNRPPTVANRSQDGKAFVDAFKDRGGLRAKIITSGEINVGDTLITLEDAE